jgi:glycosyltransferase involved in cell wall biosynthesis
MKIWLIMSGEPLEQFGERPHRIGILSKMLVEQGHNVTWWTTDYDHQHKKYLYGKDTEIINDFGVPMIFLHPKTPYNKNISFSRIKNHKETADKFKNISYKKEKPDIILCAYPTIELSYEAIKYGEKFNIPIIIDIRDMWPDIFLEVLPHSLHFLGKIALYPIYKKARYVFKNAYRLSAMTDEFIKFGLGFAKRKKNSLDKSFFFGYPRFILTKDIENQSFDKLQKLGLNKDDFNICYFGTIGKQFDFNPVINVAKQLQQSNKNIKFIICGIGDNLDELKNNAKGLDNIIFMGWINQNNIWTIMKYSALAFAPYINKKDFLASIPNKAIEYLAGGLPILSSIEGVLGEILKDNKCGFVYDNSDDLYEYIIKLKNDNILREKMSKNALFLFNQNFSADNVYSEMIEHLVDIVKKYKEKNETLS